MSDVVSHIHEALAPLVRDLASLDLTEPQARTSFNRFFTNDEIQKVVDLCQDFPFASPEDPDAGTDKFLCNLADSMEHYTWLREKADPRFRKVNIPVIPTPKLVIEFYEKAAYVTIPAMILVRMAKERNGSVHIANVAFAFALGYRNFYHRVVSK